MIEALVSLPPGRRWACALALVALLVGCRGARYVSDRPHDGIDMPIILAHLADADRADIAGWLTGRWVQQNAYYRPLTSLSFWLDYQLYGERAFGWRVHNLLLVVLTALVLAGFVREQTGGDLAGLLAGLTCAHDEVLHRVIYFVAPRTDVLAVLCLLGAARLAWRWGRQPSRGRLAGALGLMIVGCLSKELALAGALLLPAAAACAGARGRPVGQLAGAAAAVAVGFWLLRCAALGDLPWAPSYDRTPFEARTVCQAFVTMLLPPLGGSMFYAGLRPISFLLLTTWLQLGTVALRLIGWVVAFRQVAPPACFWLLWIAGTALPSAPFARIAVHYWFGPDLGHAALPAVGLAWLAGRLFHRGQISFPRHRLQNRRGSVT